MKINSAQNNQTFLQEYSDWNLKMFLRECQKIPTGIEQYSSRNARKFLREVVVVVRKLFGGRRGFRESQRKDSDLPFQHALSAVGLV